MTYGREYLQEIREQICSRCVERPPEGPPSGSRGKPCGVELHLPELVAAVHLVHSNQIEPYQEANRRAVCQSCPFQYSAFCPCPMDSLAVLVVQAIEKVDQCRVSATEERKPAASPPGQVRPDVEETFRPGGQPDIQEISRVYEAAVGTWTGCDWPVLFGLAELNVENCTAAAAKVQAKVAGEKKKEWEAAVVWLEEVERRAREAQFEAEMALKEARAGAWREAAEHAEWAWSLEFTTGRPFHRQPATWKRLYEVLAAAAWVNRESETVDTFPKDFGQPFRLGDEDSLDTLVVLTL